MAASPAISSAAARSSSSYARLSKAPLRAPRAAVVSFPSRPSPRPAALVADARASRRPVVATAAAGHQRLMGSLTNTEGLRFGVVVARFNEIVTNLLLQGALETFQRYSVKEENITIRGDTTHYDAVANSAASGVLNAGLSAGQSCQYSATESSSFANN